MPDSSGAIWRYDMIINSNIVVAGKKKCESFADAVRMIRKSLKLTQREIAEITYLSRDTIYRLENTDDSFTEDTLLRLSKALKGYDLVSLYKSFQVEISHTIEELANQLDFALLLNDRNTLQEIRIEFVELQKNKLADVDEAILKQYILYVDVYDEIAFQKLGVIDNAISKILSALEITNGRFDIFKFKKYHYSPIELRLLNIYAICKSKQSKLSDTFECDIMKFSLDYALNYFNTFKYRYLIPKLYFNYANMLHILDCNETVVDVCQDAIEYSIEKGVTNNLAMMYYRLGIAQSKLKDQYSNDEIIRSLKYCIFLLNAYRKDDVADKIIKITLEMYKIDLRNLT